MDRLDNSFSLLTIKDTRALIACFLSADIVLASAYLFLFLHGNPMGNDQPGMFDLAEEGNIPAWYSATKLFVLALCIYFYGRFILLRDKGAGWLILAGAALFVYLSLDEGGQLHERLGDRLTRLLTGGVGSSETPFEITGLWMVFFGPPLFLALVGSIVFLRRRLSIPYDVFAKALAGAVVFVIAAAPGDILVNYLSGDALVIQTGVEEFGEMVGVSLILWAAMTLLAQQQPLVLSRASLPARAGAPERARRPQELPRFNGGGLAAPVAARAHRQSP